MSGPNNTSQNPDELGADRIAASVAQATAAIVDAATSADLKTVRTAHLGDTSPLALANRAIGKLAPQQRKQVGQLIGQARATVSRAFEARQAEIAELELAAALQAERVDVTLPVASTRGAVHPITAQMYRMCDVFIAMGWEVVEGPELEAEWLNFDSLNFTPDHPARFLSDTLFIDPVEDHKLLRTQTSPVQMRTLLERDLPVYIVSPGKVFRADEYDATHLPVFHQLEGLVVDKGISMADLRGTLDHLAKAMFGPDTESRMRPHYFPFTEPSGEVDLRCFVCHGESVSNPDAPCRTCRSQGWIEWGGCGVVNPRVLAAAGIDTEVYSGFAFGMGVDRTVMFANNAPDLRDFVEGDIRFSRSMAGVAR